MELKLQYILLVEFSISIFNCLLSDSIQTHPTILVSCHPYDKLRNFTPWKLWLRSFTAIIIFMTIGKWSSCVNISYIHTEFQQTDQFPKEAPGLFIWYLVISVYCLINISFSSGYKIVSDDSSRSFIVVIFTVSSLIYLGWIFASRVRYASRHIVLHKDTQLLHHHWLKDLLFHLSWAYWW